VELRARQRTDERQALAEGTAGVEVGRKRNRRTGVGERSGGRHRAVEEERTGGEYHRCDVAPCERADAALAGCLEVVDRARAELDREVDRSELVELVPVQAQSQALLAASSQVTARLLDAERSFFDEDVCRLGELGRTRQDLGKGEVEIGVGVAELGRHGVGA
jgi:hypothetical protein